MNRPALLRLDRTVREVDRLAEHVHHAAERRGPTGMEIGAPVSIAVMPRCMPSVAFIATVRHAVLAGVARPRR